MKSQRLALAILCLISVGLCAQQLVTPGTSRGATSTQARKSTRKSISVPPSSFSVKAVAVSSYTPVFRGISRATITVSAKHPIAAYVLRVDLQERGIRFYSTQHEGLKETISETSEAFARQEHLAAAINTGFFSPCCSAKPEGKDVRGLMISEGVVVSPVSTDAEYRDSLLITKDNHATIEAVTPETDLSLFDVAVTGSAEIVQDGKNTGNINELNDAAHDNPRTVVGLSRNRRYLYMVAIDGRQPGYSMGTTNTESATILLALHAWTGLNLDGGGSTSMVLENKSGEVISVNKPSGGTERWVAASLGVYALPLRAAEK